MGPDSTTLHAALSDLDPPVAAAIDAELRRQRKTLEMIASENVAPLAVLQAQGSVLTNKYAEGYPGRRYYGGCEHVDIVEQLAIDRARHLFGARYANVQPHSGAQANAAVMSALLQPQDTILGLDLAHGGHLTHGMRINFSGRLYRVVSYRVRPDGLPHDPWLRVHVRAGARIDSIAPASMTVAGSLEQWRRWTGLPFDVPGDVEVPGALVPVRCEPERGYAVYVEPNVWMRHLL